jgi:hypothetical protein
MNEPVQSQREGLMTATPRTWTPRDPAGFRPCNACGHILFQHTVDQSVSYCVVCGMTECATRGRLYQNGISR